MDIRLLKETIDDSGMTIKAIAERSGIPRYTLDRRMNGEGEFTVSEVLGLTKALNLTPEIRRNIFLI